MPTWCMLGIPSRFIPVSAHVMTTRVYAQSISAYHTYHTTGFYICEWPAYLLLTGTMSLQVLPGARVPADGEVVTGDSYVDEALITGEPLPVVKRPGDAVISGTVNGSGTFNMQATRVGANTTLNQVRVPSKVLPCICTVLADIWCSKALPAFPRLVRPCRLCGWWSQLRWPRHLSKHWQTRYHLTLSQSL